MSGIFGIVNFDGKPIDKEAIKKILSLMNAGNNDYSGKLILENACFGQTTFWTTSESKADQQPITSRDGSLVLVADARIDNRDELAHELDIEKSGSVATDAELILLAFSKWKDRCVDHLIGDFSFVIYNKLTKEIFFARDHLGFRPLYYLHTENSFAFCSRIQPLLELDLVSRELDSESFDYSLLFDAIPKNRTYYKHIFRFIGGTLSWLKKNRLQITRYWKPEQYELRHNIDFNDAADEFLEIFEKAVRARLRSVYPVGFELSGGLDSSSVAIMANNLSPRQDLLPLSLRFGTLQCDEGQYINEVLKILNRPAIEVRADELDFSNTYTLPGFYQDRLDWPADLFFIPHLVLASTASDAGTRVLLTGQGGDEVMQGSRWVYNDYLKQLNLVRMLEEFLHSSSKKYDLLQYVIKPQLPGALINVARSLKNIRYTEDMKRAMGIKREMADNLKFDDAGYYCKTAWDTARMLNNPEAALWRDSNPYNLLSQNNIEIRHPFFDIRLIALRLSLPANYFYHNGEFKTLLRKAMKDILPEKILNRQDKADFGEIVVQQLNTAKTQTNAVHERLRSLFSPQVWINRNKLHAKCSFHDHEKFLEWKLLNMYYWINTGARS
jgi:asparagine synthase (glutamine-hydrolysing)